MFEKCGFLVQYHYEDMHDLYETGVLNNVYCSESNRCIVSSIPTYGGWHLTKTQSWHIKAISALRVVSISCAGNGSNTNADDFHLTVYDGPGLFSPTIQPHFIYKSNASYTFTARAGTFQMYIHTIYNHNISANAVTQQLNCKYINEEMQASMKTSTSGCEPRRIHYQFNYNMAEQQVLAKTEKNNTVCLWMYDLTYLHGLKLRVTHLLHNMLTSVEYRESDSNIKFSTSSLCLYGGLYVYEIHHNEA
jgi:hypothetical protein